jgi:hypothetical protein
MGGFRVTDRVGVPRKVTQKRTQLFRGDVKRRVSVIKERFAARALDRRPCRRLEDVRTHYPLLIPVVSRASSQMIGQCPEIIENIARVIEKSFVTEETQDRQGMGYFGQAISSSVFTVASGFAGTRSSFVLHRVLTRSGVTVISDALQFDLRKSKRLRSDARRGIGV